MVKNSNFVVKIIFMVCLCVYFLGAENRAENRSELPEPKSENTIPQAKPERMWRLFGSVGLGRVFGVTDGFSETYTWTQATTTTTHTTGGKNYDRIYFEVNFGTEFMFKSGNGFNVLFDVDNQMEGFGANYVYEMRGKDKFAFITGLDIGSQFLGSDFASYFLRDYKSAAPLMRYNLGIRYRNQKNALILIAKIPLYGGTLKYEDDTGDSYKIKNYSGVAVAIMYSRFFRL